MCVCCVYVWATILKEDINFERTSWEENELEGLERWKEKVI